MADFLPTAGKTPSFVAGGAQIHFERHSRTDCACSVAQSAAAALNLGVYPRPFFDRSDLVCFFVLDSRFSQQKTRLASAGFRRAARRHLPYCRCGQHRGRLDFFGFDKARLVGQQIQKNRAVRLRGGGRAGNFRFANLKFMDGGFADRTGGGSAPGLVGKFVCDGLRRVSQKQGWLGRGHQRHGGCSRRKC